MAGYLLLVTGYWLLVTGYWLLVTVPTLRVRDVAALQLLVVLKED